MSLKEFMACQPTCDFEGCRWVIEGDGPIWFPDSSHAREAWEDSEGWADGTVWFCEDHRYEPHAIVVLGVQDTCDRCGTEEEEHLPPPESA